MATNPDIIRGERFVARLDTTTADWFRNEWGVDYLLLSEDPVSGALTFVIRTPAGLEFPERAHFYDCDEDLFQMEGEFHHQEDVRYHQGDYIWRPPGSVYGASPGSNGGITIAALNRKPVRYHFSEDPEPWTGEYLVDRRWNPRSISMMHVHGAELAWEESGQDSQIAVKQLRGIPGHIHPDFGACDHSPWSADSVFMLRIAAGYDGALTLWPDFILEVMVTGGRAAIDGAEWFRGCYSFDGFGGNCIVIEDLELYVRAFARLS